MSRDGKARLLSIVVIGVISAGVIVGSLLFFRKQIAKHYADQAQEVARFVTPPSCLEVANYAKKAARFDVETGFLAYHHDLRLCITKSVQDHRGNIALLEGLLSPDNHPIVQAALYVLIADELRYDSNNPLQCNLIEQSARNALRVYPAYGYAWSALGGAHVCRGEWSAAVSAYRYGLKLMPTPRLYTELAVALSRQSPAGFSEAKLLYKRAMEILGIYWPPYYDLGLDYYLVEGDSAHAAVYLEEFLAIYKQVDGVPPLYDPEWSLALAHGILGDAYDRFGNRQRSQQHYLQMRKIVEANPKFTDLNYRSRVSLQYHQGILNIFDGLYAKAQAAQ